jgi:hypothetical protein
MKQIKHSKVKNTGLIFELLVRQVASDTMSNKNSKSLQILKKSFSADSELMKELKLYRSLQEEIFKSDTKSLKFVEAVISARKQLNEALLKREKYNLIKSIKSNFLIEDFFKSRVGNYKLHASIYKTFEFAEADDPKQYINNKFSIIEHVNRTNKQEKSMPLVTENKDIRLLASKMIIDKFNEKYSSLTGQQKQILREYINNVTNSENLKKYVLNETRKIQKDLLSFKTKVTSKIIRIKINEVAKLLNNLQKKHLLEDKDILTILRYHELINELKKVGNS